jgi:S1-C subfamily serine protease
MLTVAHAFQDVGCNKEVGKQRNPVSEPVQFYHFRREKTHCFRATCIFALLLLSRMHLWAYSIPEIVAKTKPAVVEIVAIDQNGSPTTVGTGFFVSSDGLVVTNFHVINGATSLAAINNNGAKETLEPLLKDYKGPLTGWR